MERRETDSRRGRTLVTADPTVVTAHDVVSDIAIAGYRAEAVGS